MLFVQPMHGCSNVAPQERKLDTESSSPDRGRPTGRPARVYRLPPDGFAGAPPLDWLANGEAGAASFGFSFFGFFASRLPRCSPLDMACLRCGLGLGSVEF